MTTQQIKDIAHLVSMRTSLDPSHELTWWRGQSCDWDLVPHVYRMPSGAEQDLVTLFTQKAYPRYHDCPRSDDRISWLFLMQHYGLPTRLLDWTESPLIAAYFACNDAGYDNSDGVVWGLLPYKLNQSVSKRTQLFEEDDKHLTHLINAHFSRCGFAATVKPVAAMNTCPRNPRMAAQLSRFTIHGDKIPLTKMSGADNFLVKLNIPAAAKHNMRLDLGVLGIRRSACSLTWKT